MPVKLERFDKKILQLLEEKGEQPLADLQAQFKIAPQDFQKRVKTLSKQNYLRLTSEDNPIAQLGIKGYNALEKKAKKTTKPLAVQSTSNETQPITQTTDNPPELQNRPEKPLIEAHPFEIPETARATVQQKTEYNPLIHGPLKLLTEKTWLAKQNTLISTAVQDPALQKTGDRLPSAAQKLNLQWQKEHETCELCKADFKISLKPEENNPVYGHCFCGAAYHKDCYETLAQNKSPCARCGRQIEIKTDPQTREALKQIKNLFD